MKKLLIITTLALMGATFTGFSQEKDKTKANKKPVTDSIKTLDAVTVSAKTPVIQQKAGMMIMNVSASSTSIGMTALELLEKSPGVTVDNDGKISLKGKQGVLVLVDGKPTYMSGADLAAYLKNMQSSNIDQIEIMTNPPAKYDAAGNSGIINIKTKKGLKKGMNGNTNIGYAQGVYGKLNGGLNLNYRNEKLNVFGGYNGGVAERFTNININRRFYDAGGVFTGSADQLSSMPLKNTYHTVKAGADYSISGKDIVGFVINGNFSNNDQEPFSFTNVRDGAGDVLYKLHSQGESIRRSTNVSTNVNYKHRFDSAGRELSADADYVYYKNNNTSSLSTQGYTSKDQVNGIPVLLNGDIPSNIHIYSAKLDYIHPFSKGLKLETGLKTSIVNTDNKVDYIRNNGSGWLPDDRSNHFVYEENINAGYAVLSGSFKKWELTAGLRLENTYSKGHQLTNDSLFERSYTNLFPNAGIKYEVNGKNELNLSYSRRITRPDYEDLNPFVFFLDSLTYSQGNPYLQPQFTQNIEISHTYNKFLTTTLNYTHTNNIITQLLKQDTEKKLTYQTRDNFNTMDQFGIAVSANFPVATWWEANTYLNAFNNRFDGLYQNDPVKMQFTSMTINLSNNFTLGKGWTVELSGWYLTKAADGLLVINDMGSASAGFSKQVLKGKGSVKLGVRDIFYSEKFSAYARYSDVDVDVSGRKDSRQVSLNFNYRFGNKSIAFARKKSGGATDEQSRIKN